MTGIVEVQYQNATFTANTASIVVGNGGKVELSNNGSFSLEGSFVFSTLSVSSGAVNFYNSSTGTSVNGNVKLPITSSGNGDPTITANNFSGSVELQWPTKNSGTQYQQLSSGESITLTDFAG